MLTSSERHRDILLRTSKIAKLFKKNTTPIGKSFPGPSSADPIPDLFLQVPDNLQSELDDRSTPAELRDGLVQVISELKTEYQRVYRQAYQRALSSPLPQLSAMGTLGQLLQRRFTTQTVTGIMQHYNKEKRAYLTTLGSSRSTPKFNTEYTSYLKAYFQYNAYPSPHDREVMAKKSMMSSRQIEVWFQNHRRTEKKAGRPCVKRKASDAGPSQSQIDRIEQEMGMYGVSKEERHGSDAERERWEYVQGEKGRGFASLSALRYPPAVLATDPLALPPRPIPAFVPGYTPFLSGAAPPAVYLPPPTWARRPATQPLAHHAERPSFTELCGAFATGLRIYSDIQRVSDESVPPAATCAITARLEPRYHFALVNTPERRAWEARRRREREEEEKRERAGMRRQVSWSSASSGSGSEESFPTTPQSTNADLEVEPEPFDDLFDEAPVQDEVPLDIQGFVYADYPAPVIAVGEETTRKKKKKKSHYRS